MKFLKEKLAINQKQCIFGAKSIVVTHKHIKSPAWDSMDLNAKN